MTFSWVLVVGLAVGLGWTAWQYFAIRRKYQPVIDMDHEVAARKTEVERLVAELAQRAETAARERQLAEANHIAQLASITRAHEESIRKTEAQLASIEAKYQSGRAVYERLHAEISALQDVSGQIEVGLYRPSYSFDTPEKYQAALDAVWQRQKVMVKEGRATACPHAWVVGGSASEGKKMQTQLAKLMLRAFNGEAEAAVAKVSWSNVTKMGERIRKARESVNGLGTVIGVSITSEYADLALQELRLTYEHEKKKREVLEEQRELRERMKEEERAQREALRAEEEAAKEEARYEKALARARGDAQAAKGAELSKLQAKIAMLEESLAEAHAQRERAKSMAQQTKAGYVYVISNIGSFGEGVFKIGMTRRLDPMDRVRELGDASVPFEFDVHAMCYSDDAPRLENELHRQFSSRRVNQVNQRKEFFAVSIEELEAYASQRGLPLALAKLAEAREYRETMALKGRNAGEGVVTPSASAGPLGSEPLAVLRSY